MSQNIYILHFKPLMDDQTYQNKSYGIPEFENGSFRNMHSYQIKWLTHISLFSIEKDMARF